RIAATAIVFVSMAAILPVKTAMIAGGWQDAFDPQMLGAVLGGTNVGEAWIADAVASLLLVGTLALPSARRAPAVAIAAGLVLASLVLTGHAMMHDGLVGYLQQANDLVHVLASGAWVGALVPLVLILAGFSDSDEFGERERALDRFSSAGRVAVALTVLTGMANTLLIVGGWPIHWSAPYQVLLTAKIVLVIVMIGLASTNQFRFVPGLARRPLAASTAIRYGAMGEIVLGLSAIALVAVFGTLDPH
ncbi:MAG TPA: copper homeostasis membrane protein CopD, partial [Pararhizobium sp.]|nr:copper homeostasis membrane protein CopD [Pararhizobium sp.]